MAHLSNLISPQVHFGAVWPFSFTAILRAKFGDHRLQRKIALEGHRFVPSEALADGILDHLVTGNTTAVVAKAEEVADRISGNAAAGVWGLIKVCFLILQADCSSHPFDCIFSQTFTVIL